MTLFLLIYLTTAPTPQNSDLIPLNADQVDGVISAFKGEKAVLVNVWATWCAPCVKEFPHIVELRNKHADALEVIFISTDFPEQRSNAQAFLKKQKVNWPTYVKEGGDEAFINAVDERWTGALPVTVLYNKEGQKVNFWENMAAKEVFEEAIRAAIE